MTRLTAWAGLLFLGVLFAPHPALSQFGTDWTTAGFDAQRSSWVRRDPKISTESVKGPGFKMVWKHKLDNSPRHLNALTPPALFDFYIGYRGFRSLGFVGGGSGRIFVLDTDLARMEWQKSFDSGSAEGTLDCPGGMTANLTRPTPVGLPLILAARGSGRRSPGASAVGKPKEGAVTLKRVRRRPAPPPAARAGAKSARRRPATNVYGGSVQYIFGVGRRRDAPCILRLQWGRKKDSAEVSAAQRQRARFDRCRRDCLRRHDRRLRWGGGRSLGTRLGVEEGQHLDGGGRSCRVQRSGIWSRRDALCGDSRSGIFFGRVTRPQDPKASRPLCVKRRQVHLFARRDRLPRERLARRSLERRAHAPFEGREPGRDAGLPVAGVFRRFHAGSADGMARRGRRHLGIGSLRRYGGLERELPGYQRKGYRTDRSPPGRSPTKTASPLSSRDGFHETWFPRCRRSSSTEWCSRLQAASSAVATPR